MSGITQRYWNVYFSLSLPSPLFFAAEDAWQRRIKALSESSTRPSANSSRRAFCWFFFFSPPQEWSSSPFAGQPNKEKKWKSHLKGSILTAQSAWALEKPRPGSYSIRARPPQPAVPPYQSPLIGDWRKGKKRTFPWPQERGKISFRCCYFTVESPLSEAEGV